jgi:hypothetical protein
VSGLVVLIGAVRISLSLGHPFLPFSDVAFIELDVRQATHLAAHLGPYSQYGWHHPGPAMFYLFAPLYWLSGSSSRALFLDAWLLNGLTALLTVVIVRRQAGETAARIAAVAIGVYLGATGFSELINPWNPALLPLPVLLLLVAGAAAATGDRWSLALVYLVASFVVQTHVGTVPIAAGVVIIATAGFAFARRRRARSPTLSTEEHPAGRRSWRRVVRSPWPITSGLLALVWLAPIAQELAHPGNGNLTAIVRFFLHPAAAGGPSSHSLADGLAAISGSASVVPLGTPVDVLGHRYRFLAAGAVALIGLVTWFVGRRRSPFIAYLALSTPIGLAIAVVAATRVAGPYYSYLFTWASSLGIPAIIGAGVLLWSAASTGVRRLARPPRRLLRTVTALGILTALAIVAVWLDRVIIRPSTAWNADQRDSRAVAGRIEQLVGQDRSTAFTLHIVQEQGQTGPVILELAKDGYRFRVVPRMDLYGGTTAAAPTGPTFELQSHGPYEYRVLPGTPELATGTIQVYLAPGPLPGSRVPPGARA